MSKTDILLRSQHNYTSRTHCEYIKNRYFTSIPTQLLFMLLTLFLELQLICYRIIVYLLWTYNKIVGGHLHPLVWYKAILKSVLKIDLWNQLSNHYDLYDMLAACTWDSFRRAMVRSLVCSSQIFPLCQILVYFRRVCDLRFGRRPQNLFASHL